MSNNNNDNQVGPFDDQDFREPVKRKRVCTPEVFTKDLLSKAEADPALPAGFLNNFQVMLSQALNRQKREIMEHADREVNRVRQDLAVVKNELALTMKDLKYLTKDVDHHGTKLELAVMKTDKTITELARKADRTEVERVERDMASKADRTDVERNRKTDRSDLERNQTEMERKLESKADITEVARNRTDLEATNGQLQVYQRATRILTNTKTDSFSWSFGYPDKSVALQSPCYRLGHVRFHIEMIPDPVHGQHSVYIRMDSEVKASLKMELRQQEQNGDVVSGKALYEGACTNATPTLDALSGNWYLVSPFPSLVNNPCQQFEVLVTLQIAHPLCRGAMAQ